MKLLSEGYNMGWLIRGPKKIVYGEDGQIDGVIYNFRIPASRTLCLALELKIAETVLENAEYNPTTSLAEIKAMKNNISELTKYSNWLESRDIFNDPYRRTDFFDQSITQKLKGQIK